MTKKQVLNLEIMLEDFFEDSAMLGLVCSLLPYRLCWFLNAYLNFSFIRTPENDVQMTKGKNQTPLCFPVYQMVDELNQSQIILYGNRCDKFALVPELKKIDYFLLFKSAVCQSESKKYQTLLGQIPDIQLVRELDYSTIKNVGNLML